MPDEAMTVEGLVREHLPFAARVAERNLFPGVDPDEIRSAANQALFLAARKAAADGGVRDFRAYASLWIYGAIRKVRRDHPNRMVAGIPTRVRDAAEKCRLAAERLAARGIRRPSPEHLAQEAGLSMSRVGAVLAIPDIVVRQSAIDWAGDHATTATYAPSLVPLFGARPGFEPGRSCDDIHREPIPEGSRLCCMACHGSGMDGRKEFRRDPKDDPAPEPRAGADRGAVPPLRGRMKPETRDQKRQRLFAPPTAGTPGGSA